MRRAAFCWSSIESSVWRRENNFNRYEKGVQKMETLTKIFAGYTIGADAYGQVLKHCGPYGQRVLLIGGATGLSRGKPGLMKALEEGEGGLELVDTVVYGKECTYERIRELSALYKERQVDMVFGMGGGKAMDTAKGVAYELGVPVFTFPTIPSNCAAMAALSVVYKKDGGFDSFYFYEKPAVHCFIDTDILIHAPKKYFTAGMGDTIAKYFECHFSARGDALDYHSALGREISNLCFERIQTYAAQALEEYDSGRAGDGFLQTVLTIIVNTGLVSHMVEDCYNCAAAHAVCYGLDLLPGINERFLHGDLVGYGVLVQLALDNRQEELKTLRPLLGLLQIPVSLREMGTVCERAALAPMLREAVSGPDMEHIPYPVTEDMMWEAVKLVEHMNDMHNHA